MTSRPSLTPAKKLIMRNQKKMLRRMFKLRRNEMGSVLVSTCPTSGGVASYSTTKLT
jgi:hypothetical protein